MRSGRSLDAPCREPWSARVPDAATLLFALFTVCCHAVVAAGGSFRDLLFVLAGAVLVAFAAGAARAFARRRGLVSAPTTSLKASDPAVVAPNPGRGPSLFVRALGLLLAAFVLGVHASTGSVVHLWLGSVALLAYAAVAVVASRSAPSVREPAAVGPLLEPMLWAIAASSVVLVAIIHRYDHDTPFYVGIAVAAVDFPTRELMLDPIHGIAGLALHQPAHRVHTIELLSAVFSALSGASAFVAMQWITTSLAAMLVPLAFARLFRELTPRGWLVGVAVVLFVVVVTGGPNWYGNFSFVRLIHGKSVFVSVFLPLAWAYGLRFGEMPNLRRFVLLAAVQIAAVGCTSSALWSVPIAAGLGVACAVPLDRRAPRILALALASSMYVVAVGLSLVGDMGAVAATIAPATHVGQRLEDAIAWALPGGHLAAFAWASLLCAWALHVGLAQRFAVLVPLVVLLTVLNPFIEVEVQRYVTGPAYRRAMWVLPLPVLMTLVLTAPSRIARLRRFAGQALVAAALLAYGWLVPGHYGLSEENRVTLGMPRLKVRPRQYESAARLAALAPRGSAVLAPQSVALWLPSLHDHPRILYARESYLQRIRTEFGEEEAETRMRLSEAVSLPRADIEKRTRSSEGYGRRRALGMTEAFFRSKLREYDIRAVSLHQRAPLANHVRSSLAKEGFTLASGDDDYQEWVLRTEVRTSAEGR